VVIFLQEALDYISANGVGGGNAGVQAHTDVRRNSRGGKVDILLIFLRLLAMQGKLTHTKINVQCYDNSCKQCFPCKKTLY